MELTIAWQGKTLRYDSSKVMLSQANMVKAHTGLGWLSFGRALAQGDPQACQALLWLAKVQSGEPADIGEDFPIVQWIDAFNDAVNASPAVEEAPAEPDPTAGPGTVQTSA